jgi:hypothetical protein
MSIQQQGVTIDDFIRQECPIIYFHHKEEYFPCSVKQFIQHSELMESETSIRSTAELNHKPELIQEVFGEQLLSSISFYNPRPFTQNIQNTHTTQIQPIQSNTQEVSRSLKKTMSVSSSLNPQTQREMEINTEFGGFTEAEVCSIPDHELKDEEADDADITRETKEYSQTTELETETKSNTKEEKEPRLSTNATSTFQFNPFPSSPTPSFTHFDIGQLNMNLNTNTNLHLERNTLELKTLDELKTHFGLGELSLYPTNKYRLVIRNREIYTNHRIMSEFHIHEREIQCIFTEPFVFRNQTYIYLIYYLLFGYNGTLSPHEVDFEYVTYLVKIKDFKYSHDKQAMELIEPIIERVYPSSHGNGMWYSYNQCEKENNRIVMYSALGSHAFYPKAKTYRRFFGFGNDATSKGKKYDAQHNVVILADPKSVFGLTYFVKHPLHYFNGKFGTQHSLLYREGIINPLFYDGFYKFQGGIHSILQLGEVQKYMVYLHLLKYVSFFGSCIIPFVFRNSHFGFQYIQYITLFISYFLFFWLHLS